MAANNGQAELNREIDSFKTAYYVWKQKRQQTVKLLKLFADEIQKHEDNSRIATLSGASASIAGTSLAIGGAVAAFFTLGTSLILVIVGSSIAAAGGTTLLGTQLVNKLLQSSNTNLIKKAIEDDKEESRKLQKQRKEIEEKIKVSRLHAAGKCCSMAFKFGGALHTGVSSGVQLGKIGSEAGETVFKTLGNAAKAFHIAGIAFSAITLVADIYTLVSTSVEVHKGSILPVVGDVRKVAQSLEDELNVFDEELSGYLRG